MAESLSIIMSPPELVLSRMPVIFQVASSNTAEPNIRCDAEIQLSGAETGFVDSLTPGFDSRFTFELSEYIKQYLSPSFTFPDLNAEYANSPNHSQVYAINFVEFYGNPPVEHSSLLAGGKNVLWGIIPDYLKNWFYSHYNSFHQWLVQTNNCLSFWPSTRTVFFKDQVEKLFFCNTFFTAPSETLHLVITVHFTDGTTAGYLPDKTIFINRIYKVSEFHVGYNALALDTFMLNHPGKVIASYDVQIANTQEVKSSIYTYVMDYGHYPQYHQFVFRNSLGGYDTFVATGKGNSEASYAPETMEVLPWIAGYGRKTKVLDNKYTESGTCNSGFVSPQLMAALPELFLSDEVWEIIDNHRYPVMIDAQSVLRQTDQKGLVSIRFKYSFVPLNYVESFT